MSEENNPNENLNQVDPEIIAESSKNELRGKKRANILEYVPEYAKFRGRNVKIETKTELVTMSAADREKNGINSKWDEVLFCIKKTIQEKNFEKGLLEAKEIGENVSMSHTVKKFEILIGQNQNSDF